MKKLIFLGFMGIIGLISCSVEKINLSPLSGNLADTSSPSSVLRTRPEQNVSAAELSNLIASFPKFRNDAVNTEVIHLKGHLRNYIYALDEYNLVERNKALRNFEKSYKNLQKLRKFLNRDEDEVINRYLVKLKKNVYIIESTFDDKSISTQ